MYNKELLEQIYKEQVTQAAVDYLIDIRCKEGKEPRLYLPNGYANIRWMEKSGCTKIVIIGGRGTGKTFGILDYLTDKKEPFIFMRRTKTQIDICGTLEGNPFGSINRKKQLAIEPRTNKYGYDFYNTHLEIDDNGERQVVEDDYTAFATSLTTFFNLRGVDLSVYRDLFFDEIVKEPLERRLKNESTGYLNAIETIQHNNELEGKPPLRQWLAGNSDTLDCGILQAVDAISIIEKMKANQQEVYINRERDIAVFDLYDSPISKIKALTSLYKHNNNVEFTDMSLNNTFRDLSDKSIRSIPLQECSPIINLNDRICIYTIKGSPGWYITKHISGTPSRYNLMSKEERVRWKKKWFDIYVNLSLQQLLYYDSFDTKVLFDSIIYS